MIFIKNDKKILILEENDMKINHGVKGETIHFLFIPKNFEYDFIGSNLYMALMPCLCEKEGKTFYY
jgi:hypothetical protein